MIAKLEPVGTSALSDEVSTFVGDLSPEERQLLILRDELYDGSWDEMRRDLEDRRDGKPFIFALVNKIEEDLERINRIASFEGRAQVNLTDYIVDDAE